MDQKTMAIGAVIAVIIVFGLVFVLYQQQESMPKEEDFELDLGPVPTVEVENTPVEPGSILNDCGTQENSYLADECWLFEAYSELDAEKCLNIGERPRRIDCIRAIARDFESEDLRESIGLCDSYFGESAEKALSCFENILPKMRSEKLAICNKFFADDEPQKFRCHAEVARELLDYSICDDMQKQNYRDNCYFIVDFENYGNQES